MVYGKLLHIDQNDNLCAVLEDDSSYCIFKVLETSGLEIGDIILAVSDIGSIFIENKAKKTFHQAEIVYRNLSFKKLSGLMKIN